MLTLDVWLWIGAAGLFLATLAPLTRLATDPANRAYYAVLGSVTGIATVASRTAPPVSAGDASTVWMDRPRDSYASMTSASAVKAVWSPMLLSDYDTLWCRDRCGIPNPFINYPKTAAPPRH